MNSPCVVGDFDDYARLVIAIEYLLNDKK